MYSKTTTNDYVLWIDEKERVMLKGMGYFENMLLWEVIEK